MSKYYVPSGKTTPTSYILFLVCVLVLIPILSIIYVYLVWYIPIIYINFIVTAGFGFGVGLIVNLLAIRVGKVRSPLIALVFGLLGATVGMYVSWAIWIDLVLNANETYGNSRIGITTSSTQFGQVLALIMEPKGMLEFAKSINEFGTWGIKSTAVSGLFLAIIWMVEFLIVAVISSLISYNGAKDPFCEFSNKWFEEKLLPAFNYIENPLEVVSSLESYDKTSLDGLTLNSNFKTEKHSVFSLFSSENGDNYLTITNKLFKMDKDGKPEFEEIEFVTNISIDNTLKEILLKKQVDFTTSPPNNPQ